MRKLGYLHWIKGISFILWSLLAVGCFQQSSTSKTEVQKPQPVPAATVRNEVVVAGNPITVSTAPAEPIAQLTELTWGRKSLSGTMDKAARNKAIQLALRNANFYSGELDGKIGPRTKEAVKKFQVSKNLTADGIVGARTWTELKAYLPREQTSNDDDS